MGRTSRCSQNFMKSSVCHDLKKPLVHSVILYLQMMGLSLSAIGVINNM